MYQMVLSVIIDCEFYSFFMDPKMLSKFYWQGEKMTYSILNDHRKAFKDYENEYELDEKREVMLPVNIKRCQTSKEKLNILSMSF